MKNMLFSVTTDYDLNLPYYFDGVGCNYEQEPINRPNGYGDYQWIQCRSGKGEVYLNKKKYTLEQGQGMFLLPGVPHEYNAVGGTWYVDWIIFKGTQIESFVSDILKITQSDIYYITAPNIISDKISDILKIYSQSEPTKNLLCSSAVYSILLDILRLTSTTQNTAIINNFDRLSAVMKYIDNHFSEPISLAELATAAALTPEYLCSLFKKSTAQTLFEYINRLRIKKSKELLLTCRNIPIKEIAHRVGFNDASYFGYIFKKIENITPGEMRSLYGRA